MTTNNYTNLSNDELLAYVNSLNLHPNKLKIVLNNQYPDLFSEITNRTKFLEEDSPFPARLYCIEHGISTQPICSNSNCINPVKWEREFRRFRPYCSCKCRSTDQQYKDRVCESNIERFGVPYASQSEEVKRKMVNTFIEHFGVDNPMKCECVVQKGIETNLNTYGVEHPSQSDETKQSTIDHFQTTLGVDNPFQLEEVKKKIQSTLVERYGCDSPMKCKVFQEKAKATSLKRYGVEYPVQSKEIQNRMVEYFNERYGVDNPFQLDEVKEKSKETNRLRYGVDYYSQSSDYHKNKKHKFVSPKYPNMSFDSSWEFRVYDFCIEHAIDVVYQPDVSIPFEYTGVSHTYHPDFLISGKLFEVKGNHFFRLNEHGVEEMYCPYRNPSWSESDYAQVCGLYEAKHQCMLRNGVAIIRGDCSIQSLTELFLDSKIHSV